MAFKKIIVLGNSGFIGKHLESYLVNQFPDIKVIGYSTKDIDLTDEKDAQKLVKDFDLNTAVVMCSMVKKEFGDNLDSYVKNLTMAINLCRVLDVATVKRFVYVSSTAVYGEDIENTSITEQTYIQPTSYYGMAKYASENLFQKVFSSKHAGKLLILRPPFVYGAKDRSQAYGPAGFIKKALANEKVILWGDGMELREFIYIDDLLDVVGRMLLGGHTGVINVVSGMKYNFKDILDIIETQLKTTLCIETRERTKNKANHCFSNNLIKSLLPGIIFTSLDKGISNTIKLESALVK